MFSNQAEYMMVLNLNEPKQMAPISVDVIYGQVNFRSSRDQSDQNPLIAITANYDSSAISPELAFSMEASGSSVIASLAMSKIFS